MPSAKHHAVEEQLRKEVNAMEVGAKLPAVSKLRERYGVSQGTVLRAIENLVHEGMLERRPNRGAFVSRPSLQARTLGVIWTDIVEQVTGEALTKHPYTTTMLHALQDEAARMGRNILVTSGMDPDEPEFVGRNGEVAGIAILHNHDLRLVDAYISRRLPVVLLDPIMRPHGIPFVTSDHHAEFRSASRRLLEIGHRRLLHLTIKQHLWIPRAKRSERLYNHVVEERARGVRDAVAEAGGQAQVAMHRLGKPPWNAAAAAVLNDIIKKDKPTACICFNDDVAAWFLGFCRDRGIRVPQDMSVVGHDDTGVAGRLTPSLTSIRAPLEAMGREAVRLLVQRIDEGALMGPGIVLPGKLMERESTAAVASGKIREATGGAVA
jgi:LacI family transcriptional regulator